MQRFPLKKWPGVTKMGDDPNHFGMIFQVQRLGFGQAWEVSIIFAVFFVLIWWQVSEVRRLECRGGSFFFSICEAFTVEFVVFSKRALHR